MAPIYPNPAFGFNYPGPAARALPPGYTMPTFPPAAPRGLGMAPTGPGMTPAEYAAWAARNQAAVAARGMPAPVGAATTLPIGVGQTPVYGGGPGPGPVWGREPGLAGQQQAWPGNYPGPGPATYPNVANPNAQSALANAWKQIQANPAAQTWAQKQAAGKTSARKW